MPSSGHSPQEPDQEQGSSDMVLSEEKLKIRNAILDFEKQIDEMHTEFHKYRYGETNKRPDWGRLERSLIDFSRKKFFDYQLSTQLDRVLYKFQNRKKIWLSWIGYSP